MGLAPRCESVLMSPERTIKAPASQRGSHIQTLSSPCSGRSPEPLRPREMPRPRVSSAQSSWVTHVFPGAHEGQDLGLEVSIAALPWWSAAARRQPAVPPPLCYEILSSNPPDSLEGHNYCLHLMLRTRSNPRGHPSGRWQHQGPTPEASSCHSLLPSAEQVPLVCPTQGSVLSAWHLRGGMIQVIREGFLKEVALMEGSESQQLHIDWKWEFQAEKSLGKAAGQPPSTVGTRGGIQNSGPGHRE